MNVNKKLTTWQFFSKRLSPPFLKSFDFSLFVFKKYDKLALSILNLKKQVHK
tara:strand:- start:4482 stop:4637 length:156 start_codon:yes stop_codon:yes gene_type:complete